MASDGTWRHLHANGTFIIDKQRREPQLTTILRDETERLSNEQALNEARASLEARVADDAPTDTLLTNTLSYTFSPGGGPLPETVSTDVVVTSVELAITAGAPALVSPGSTIPYTFTVSSHLIVTVALALVVFFTVLFYGLYKNGLKFFKIFVPSGVPIAILPLVMFIEVLSFFLRPVSHSVRLFANMLAGHIALKVFASFIGMLGALGFLGWAGAVLPLGLTMALTALELLVAFLQAYVFAILTCIYLNDALHPGH